MQQPPQQQAKPSFEHMVLKYMANQDTIVKQQGVTIQNLERQIGQLAKQLQERPQGALPSNTVVNPKETAMAIQLRSGKALDEPHRYWWME